ncbi:MAG: TIGR04013 family B12-binding domain/radical SAM domain-containing protein [Polyangiaceae bacterium]
MSSPRPPLLVVHHVRSGLTALNVVSAALQSHPRTRDLPVRFAKDPQSTANAAIQAWSEGHLPVVAWSFYSPDFGSATADLASVRQCLTALPVSALHIAGGVHATAEPRQTLEAGFDLVALGEGEATLVELFLALLDGRDPRRLRGIAHMAGGSFVSNGPGERRPLDDFPGCNLREGKWNPIEITRGCVYACSFCQTPYMFKARFRHRSPANVAEHTAALRRDGARYMRFISPTSLSYGSDDTSVNLAAVEELLARVREEIGPDGKVYFGTFPSEVRPEHVSVEALALLARYADNRSLVIGGQSGSPRMLAETRRGHGVSEIERAVRLCVEAGFRPDVDLLLGLPGETEDDRRMSMDLSRRLAAMGARMHSHAFMPLPGTPLRARAPSEIDEASALEMARMESDGAMYGQWRRQVITAQELLRNVPVRHRA